MFDNGTSTEQFTSFAQWSKYRNTKQHILPYKTGDAENDLLGLRGGVDEVYCGATSCCSVSADVVFRLLVLGACVRTAVLLYHQFHPLATAVLAPAQIDYDYGILYMPR